MGLEMNWKWKEDRQVQIRMVWLEKSNKCKNKKKVVVKNKRGK